MADLMKRDGGFPQLWICFAIYTSVVLAHGAPLARSAGDPDECSCSPLEPSLFVAGEIAWNAIVKSGLFDRRSNWFVSLTCCPLLRRALIRAFVACAYWHT